MSMHMDRLGELRKVANECIAQSPCQTALSRAHPDMACRAVFLDRDGTINVEKNYVHRVEDFEFVPGAIQALQLLCRANIDIMIVSNQAGVARGLFSEADLAAV